MRNSEVVVLSVLIVTAAAISLSGCGAPGSAGSANVVTVKGSDTMVILCQRWAESYMRLQPSARIQVTGGGSGTGIAALINGGTDICQASRPMNEKEKAQVRARHGQDVNEIPVALDGVAVYVHQSSHITELSEPQVKGIYTGTITSWRDLGGSDQRIVAYSRENNSGTYVFFKEHVLGKEDFARNVQTLPGTAAVVNAVSKDPASIGYGGIAYAKDIRAVPIRRSASDKPVGPSLESVQNGTYPLSRNLYFYTVGEPQGQERKFIDWVLSAEGQRLCETVGYYPLIRN